MLPRAVAQYAKTVVFLNVGDNMIENRMVLPETYDREQDLMLDDDAPARPYCAICDEYIVGDYIHLKDGDNICDACYEHRNTYDEED